MTRAQPQFIQQLIQTGLSEKEARCYVSLLKVGQGTAYKVALVAGLKKPITYAVLEQLRMRGLALVVPHSDRRVYIAQDPETYLFGIDNAVQSLKRSFPILLSEMQSENAPALLFEGEQGLKDGLLYKQGELHNCEILALYGRGSKKLTVIPKPFAEHNKILYEQGCSVRAIAPKHASLDIFRSLDKKYGWKTRELDTDLYDLGASIEITPLFVRVISYSDKTAIIMHSPHVIASMKSVFECIWKLSGKTA